MRTSDCIHAFLQNLRGLVFTLFVIGSILASTTTYAALLGTYDFQGDTFMGEDPAANPNVQWNAFERHGVAAYEESPYNTVFASKQWPQTATPSELGYVSVTIQAKQNYLLTLTDIRLYGYNDQGEGPANYNVTVTFNNVTQTSSTFSNGGPRDFNFNDIGPTSKPIVFRIYGWNATSSEGILYFNDVSFNGDVTPVPEPVNLALGGFGLIAGVGCLVRRLWRKPRAKAEPATK